MTSEALFYQTRAQLLPGRRRHEEVLPHAANAGVLASQPYCSFDTDVGSCSELVGTGGWVKGGRPGKWGRMVACDGTRKGFEAKLIELGVKFRANQASTGKMNGYSFSLEGWTDAGGEQVWLQSSKIHKQLRWSQLEADLAERRQELKALTAWYKRPAPPLPAPYKGDYRARGNWQAYSDFQSRKLRELRQEQEQQLSYQSASKLVAMSYPGSVEGAIAAARAQPRSNELSHYSMKDMLEAAKRAENTGQPDSGRPCTPPPTPGRGRGR